MTLVDQISAVGPLGDALNGSPLPPATRGRNWHGPTNCAEQQLSSRLRAHLALAKVDLLCVEVISPDQIVIHNSREWRPA